MSESHFPHLGDGNGLYRDIVKLCTWHSIFMFNNKYHPLFLIVMLGESNKICRYVISVKIKLVSLNSANNRSLHTSFLGNKVN